MPGLGCTAASESRAGGSIDGHENRTRWSFHSSGRGRHEPSWGVLCQSSSLMAELSSRASSQHFMVPTLNLPSSHRGSGQLGELGLVGLQPLRPLTRAVGALPLSGVDVIATGATAVPAGERPATFMRSTRTVTSGMGVLRPPFVTPARGPPRRWLSLPGPGGPGPPFRPLPGFVWVDPTSCDLVPPSETPFCLMFMSTLAP